MSAEGVAAWDHPKVLALAKALSEAEMFYDDRDWLVLAEVALVHLGLMEWVEVPSSTSPSSSYASAVDSLSTGPSDETPLNGATP